MDTSIVGCPFPWLHLLHPRLAFHWKKPGNIESKCPRYERKDNPGHGGHAQSSLKHFPLDVLKAPRKSFPVKCVCLKIGDPSNPLVPFGFPLETRQRTPSLKNDTKVSGTKAAAPEPSKFSSEIGSYPKKSEVTSLFSGFFFSSCGQESAREFRLGTPRGLSGLSGLGGPAAPRALSPSRKRREKFGERKETPFVPPLRRRENEAGFCGGGGSRGEEDFWWQGIEVQVGTLKER